ncbi:NADH:flavin oxidoreductase/NADH oxidase family protein [Caballeronia sp. 15715]|uniref:NADH:flavin oxidoreductase/NADH oxidase family protein n=1 Tax=unclassified Caballeronia TaxID=2646786 RepID=UPI0039E2EE01
MTNLLSQPIELPCGVTLKNRFAKAAMSEGMADAFNRSTPRLETLYRRWAGSGAGLLLSGNIQVDRWHLERPLNVVVDDDSGLKELAALAAAGKSGGAQFWAQISHTGRQVMGTLNNEPLAPSAVEVEAVRGIGKLFAPPREMKEADIEHAISQFAFTASRIRDAGFDGVQLHAAHGYLISQFLNPRTNKRTDKWGGSLENRSRFLISTIAAVRGAVGHGFPVAIKLNASDFQKGGFTNAECVELVKALNSTSLDLIELSGGSLEQPKVMGVITQDEGDDVPRESTLKREAYFVEFAGRVKAVAKMPIMVTGGFRTAAAMEDALSRGDLDIVGLGRPLIADPDLPRRILSGDAQGAPASAAPSTLMEILAWNNIQLERLADGLEPELGLDSDSATSEFQSIEKNNLEMLLENRR